jgi:hypothetical protein
MNSAVSGERLGRQGEGSRRRTIAAWKRAPWSSPPSLKS